MPFAGCRRSVVSVQIMQVFGCGLTRPCRGTLVLSGDTGIFLFLLVPLTDSVSPRPERHMYGLSAAILSCHCCSVLVVGG